MKTCPFCGKEIQNEAVKCRHCGRWIEKDVETSTQERVMSPTGEQYTLAEGKRKLKAFLMDTFFVQMLILLALLFLNVIIANRGGIISPRITTLSEWVFVISGFLLYLTLRYFYNSASLGRRYFGLREIKGMLVGSQTERRYTVSVRAHKPAKKFDWGLVGLWLVNWILAGSLCVMGVLAPIVIKVAQELKRYGFV